MTRCVRLAQNRVVRRGVAVTRDAEYTAAHVQQWVQTAQWVDDTVASVDTNTGAVVLTVGMCGAGLVAVLAATHRGLRIIASGGQPN